MRPTYTIDNQDHYASENPQRLLSCTFWVGAVLHKRAPCIRIVFEGGATDYGNNF